MGYEIHIARGAPFVEGDAEIELSDLTRVIGQLDWARFGSVDTVGVNPKTGEKIGVKIDRTVELRFADGSWVRVLSWHDGRLSMRAPEDFEDSQSSMRRAVRKLANELRAFVVGDEGEVYD